MERKWRYSMAVRYIEVSKVKELLSQYGGSFLDLIEELTQDTEEEIIKNMSLASLKAVIDSRDDVVATQIWSREDIHAALRAVRMQPDKNAVYSCPDPEDNVFVDKVAEKVKPSLENCTDNWDRIHAAIRECMSEEDRK